MNTKLFVGNLSFNTTENDLQDAFAAHGVVTEANLMMDRATGRPRGFAFVTMSSPEEAPGCRARPILTSTSLKKGGTVASEKLQVRVRTSQRQWAGA